MNIDKLIVDKINLLYQKGILRPEIEKIDLAVRKYKMDKTLEEIFETPAPSIYKEAFDTVQRPAHYNSGAIEVFDFIRDQKLNFALGNVVKYVSRAGKKDPAKLIEDLDKAMWYLRREIEELRKGK